MSVETVKNLSIDFKNKKIRICSASSNVVPKTYETWDVPCDDDAAFNERLEAVARDCFGGSMRFLPSSDCKAHEAYIRACDELGGDWRYAARTGLDWDSAEYADFRCRWIESFISFLRDGKRDRKRYYLTRRGTPVNVRARCDSRGFFNGGRTYATSSPKPLSFVKARVLSDSFDELEVQTF